MKQYEVIYVKRLYVTCSDWIEADTPDQAWEIAEKNLEGIDDSYFDYSTAGGDEVWVEDVKEVV